MIMKRNQVLTSLEEWEKLARPKSTVHWKDYRSAKESARAWLEREDSTRIPKELEQVLVRHPDFGPIREWEAEPECLVAFDEYRGPANVDVLVSGRDDRGNFTIVVEAKADESFGPSVDRALSDALERRLEKPQSRRLARLEELAEQLLGPASKGQPRLDRIRYQLLTATAAALAEATRTGASRAVLLVHEFQTPKTKTENHARNGRDLVRFLTRLAVEDAGRVLDGDLVGPIGVPGYTETGNSVSLYVGKATRVVEMRGPQVPPKELRITRRSLAPAAGGDRRPGAAGS